MTIEQDFLPFATGAGANVLSQAVYAALSSVATGYQSGVAQSAALNKTWRQSSIMAAVVAQFIVNQTGQPAIDDGTMATLLGNLATAIAVSARQNPVLADTGAANTYAVANLSAFTAYPTVSGLIIDVSIANANTGASTLNVDGLGIKPIYGLGLQALQGGELVAKGIACLMYIIASTVNSGNGAWVLMECLGGAQQIPNAMASQHAATLGQVQSGASTYAVDSGAVNAYVVTLSPAPTSLTDGLRVRFRPTNSNTNASTLNLNAFGVKNIVGQSLQPLQGTEIIANSDVEVVYNTNAGAFVLVSGYASGRLLGITTYQTAGSFTFTPNPSAKTTRVRQAGGGGAGGGTQATSSSQAAAGSGGNAGNYAEYAINGAISGTVAVTIGAGGTAVSGNSGNVGGSTSFGTYCTTPGGNGGLVGGAISTFPSIQFAPSSNTGSTFSGVTTLVNSPGGLAFNSLVIGNGNGQALGGRPGSNPFAGASLGPSAGGTGAASIASTAAAAGFAGLGGIMIVEEFS